MTYTVFGGTLNLTQPPSPTAYLKLSRCSEVEPLGYTRVTSTIQCEGAHFYGPHCVCFREILAVASRRGD